jgi:hypothetical protein
VVSGGFLFLSPTLPYRKGMGRLWDFMDIDIASLDSSVIPEMAQYSLSFPPGIRDVKVAFVVTETNMYAENTSHGF